MSLDLWILLVLAIAGIWRAHYERRQEDAELAVERGRGFLGQSSGHGSLVTGHEIKQ